MSGDGTMIYNPMGLADLTSSMVQFSQELDQIGQEAHTLLAGSQEFFQGPSGAVNYQQAQQLINEGIQDAKTSLPATEARSTPRRRTSRRPTFRSATASAASKSH